MSRSLAKRQLVEPDFWTCPHGKRGRPEAALTYGPEVADVCASAGFVPDPQQELGLDLIFAINPDGSPASFSFCVICARQNLKSGLFLQCCIGWMFVTEVHDVVWSAHELATSLNAKAELHAIIDTPALGKYLPATKNRGDYEGNGKERVELTTGQTVWFQTRTVSKGRGLGRPKVIIDEAFDFPQRSAGALLPILLAQHHPQLLYGSSFPPKQAAAAQLLDVIHRGRGHLTPSMSYLEWLAPFEECADPECSHPKDALERGIDCALDREHLLRRANPTLSTGRITLSTLRNLRQELDPQEYARECLGWEDRDSETGPPAINSRRWRQDAQRGGMLNPGAKPPQTACAVLHTEPDRSLTALGVVGRNVDGELVMLQYCGDESQVIAALESVRSQLQVLEVALHPSTQAQTLVPALRRAGIAWHKLTSNDFAAGTASMLTKVETAGAVHVGQAELDAAVAVARVRRRGEAMVWEPAGSPVPLAPLVSVSAALYRYELAAAEPPTEPDALPSSTSTTAGPMRPRADDVTAMGF